MGRKWKRWQIDFLFSWALKSLQMVIAATKLKDTCSLEEYLWQICCCCSRVRLFVTPWTTAHQASLSITNFQSSPKPMSIKLVMPSNHFILCCPLLLLPSIFPNIRVFSNESALRIRWPKYHFMANRCGDSGNSDILHFFGLQNHCRWWLQPWN